MIVSDEQQRDSDQHTRVSVLPTVSFPSRLVNYFMRCVLAGGSLKAELETDIGAGRSLDGTPGRWPRGCERAGEERPRAGSHQSVGAQSCLALRAWDLQGQRAGCWVFSLRTLILCLRADPGEHQMHSLLPAGIDVVHRGRVCFLLGAGLHSLLSLLAMSFLCRPHH